MLWFVLITHSKCWKMIYFFNIMCTGCQLQWLSYVSHQHHASYHVLIICFWSDFFIRVRGDALPGRNHCQAKHQCLRPLQPKKEVILATVRTYCSCLCGTKNWYIERQGNSSRVLWWWTLTLPLTTETKLLFLNLIPCFQWLNFTRP